MQLAILHHETVLPDEAASYFICALESHWRESGIEVRHALGARNLPHADAVLVHVDLTRVPSRFVRAASACPLVLNGRVVDIGKWGLPGRDPALRADRHTVGPVIVKTALNHRAVPERRAARRVLRRGMGVPWVERFSLLMASLPVAARDYAVYPSGRQVPWWLWMDRRVVVERFLPEREGTDYVLHQAYVGGSVVRCWRLVSDTPVIRWGKTRVAEPCEVEPTVVAYAAQVGLDYGKIDYVYHEGRAVVLDVNKTLGGPVKRGLISEALAEGLARLCGAVSAGQSAPDAG